MEQRQIALSESRRAAVWVVTAATLMVTGLLIYVASTGDLTPYMAVAISLGAFVSFVLGGSLASMIILRGRSPADGVPEKKSGAD